MTAIIALLTGTEPGALAVECNGVQYQATSDYLAIGVLLFALGQHQLEHTLPALSKAAWFFVHARDVLNAYARGQKAFDGGPVLPPEQLAEWVAGAAALAPDEDKAANIRQRILQQIT